MVNDDGAPAGSGEANSPPSSSAASEDGSNFLWLDVVEDDELKGATRIKVTVSEVIEKRGKKKRKRYQCNVILCGASDEEVGGFKRFNHPFNDDPRSFSDAKGTLKAKAMADFRRQKRARQREQGDLSGSNRDDGPCFCLLLFIVPMLTSLFLLSASCSLLPGSYSATEARGDGNQGYQHRPQCPLPVQANRHCAFLSAAAANERCHRCRRTRPHARPKGLPRARERSASGC